MAIPSEWDAQEFKMIKEITTEELHIDLSIDETSFEGGSLKISVTPKDGFSMMMTIIEFTKPELDKFIEGMLEAREELRKIK